MYIYTCMYVCMYVCLYMCINNMDNCTIHEQIIYHHEVLYSQTWLDSHCLQHQPLYNDTHGRNGFSGLCTKCPGYNNYNNLVIIAHFSGNKGVVVNKFDCMCMHS